MTTLTPQTFPGLAGVSALSERSRRDHYTLYQGYVSKFNELSRKLYALQQADRVNLGADIESAKVDITYALGAVKNHELFFNILGSGGKAAEIPPGPFADAIAANFHTIPQYLADLRQTALLARAWAWTAYDLDHHTLFNYSSGGQGLPMPNALPILALDLYGHAYFYDFGQNKAAYITTILAAIDWPKVAVNFAKAQKLAGAR